MLRCFKHWAFLACILHTTSMVHDLSWFMLPKIPPGVHAKVTWIGEIIWSTEPDQYQKSRKNHNLNMLTSQIYRRHVFLTSKRSPWSRAMCTPVTRNSSQRQRVMHAWAMFKCDMMSSLSFCLAIVIFLCLYPPPPLHVMTHVFENKTECFSYDLSCPSSRAEKYHRIFTDLLRRQVCVHR